MLISYKHKFIFIHIYKVAGTSIRVALGDYAHYPPNRVYKLLEALGLDWNIPYYKFKKIPPHSKAKHIQKELPPRIFNNFFKFVFVRNPWDWHISLYHYILQYPKHELHEIVKTLKNFDEYLEWRVARGKLTQKSFIVDRDGRQIVDYIGRFENLVEDFRYVCNTVNINASLPHLEKSRHKDYRSYYNENTFKIVEEYAREDIEFFDYKFDGK